MRPITLALLASALLFASTDAGALSAAERDAIHRAVNDLLLRMEINRRILADPALADSGIRAEVRNGAVTLSSADYEAPHYAQAVALAEAVDGVTWVRAGSE